MKRSGRSSPLFRGSPAACLSALAALLSASCSSGGGGGQAADTTGAKDTAGGVSDDVAGPGPDTASAKGYGCTCGSAAECAVGFCSDLAVCTSNLTMECQSDADCDCNARCVVVQGTQSCQVPCTTTADCPGQLACGAPAQTWTTTSGDALTLACLAPAGPAVVTWESDIAPLVQQRCTPCHVGGGTSGGVSFDAYAPTQEAVTGCGAPATLAALMAAKVSASPPCGARMPLGGQLSDAEQQRLADWVAAGAPER